VYKTFVSEQTALGRTPEQVAEDVAQLGLKHLAKLVVERKMK
jgi:hypothetical protein